MMEKELKESGVSGEVCPVPCDLRRESDIAYMFRLIRSKYGRLDVCINNAGVLRMNSLTNGNVEEWREMFDVRISVDIIVEHHNYMLFYYRTARHVKARQSLN